LSCLTNRHDHGGRADFSHVRPPVTGILASVALRLRQATVTCSYADQVTIYNCRIFTSLDAIRGFAGDDYELAVVEETARQALSRWDARVSHHQVVADLE
jgi:hypothetical protein